MEKIKTHKKRQQTQTTINTRANSIYKGPHGLIWPHGDGTRHCFMLADWPKCLGNRSRRKARLAASPALVAARRRQVSGARGRQSIGGQGLAAGKIVLFCLRFGSFCSICFSFVFFAFCFLFLDYFCFVLF